MADDAAEEEMTPWYDTGVVWYGSLRGGLQFGGGKDARFSDGASRWGIKGSGEVSEGLTATYNFEHNISTADGSQPSGRFANVGLTGGFGTLALGQIGSASYGGTGAIVDNSIFYGNSYTDKAGGGSSRHGSAVSYSLASGPVNFQLDAIIDGAVQSDSDVDRTHLGASIALGDFGKVAISHVTAKDTMMEMPVTSATTRDLVAHSGHSPSGSEVGYNNKGMLTNLDKLVWRTGTDGNGDVVNLIDPKITSTANAKTVTVMGVLVDGTTAASGQIYKLGENLYAANCLNNDQTKLADGVTCNTTNYYWVSAEKGTVADGDKANKEKSAKPMYMVETGTVTHTATGSVSKTTPGIKSNHVAAEFGFGGVTAFLGHSQVEGNASGKKDKVTHYGLRGPIGESGLSFLVQARSEDLQHSAPMDADRTPYLVSLSKSLGGGASVYFEHGTQDAKDEKAQTYLGLFVGF